MKLLSPALDPGFAGWSRAPHSRSRAELVLSRRAGSGEVQVDDLAVDGDLEDDWGVEDEEEDEDEDAASSQRSASDLAGVVGKLQDFGDVESLKRFDDVGAMGTENMKWVEVPLNDTLSLNLCQVPGAADRFLEMMRGSREPTEENRLIMEAGDTVWPAAVILARWLAIWPPVVPIEGRTVLDLGCGLGVAGISAAGLGSGRVLLQDRDPACLRAAMETAVRSEVGPWVTTLRCNFDEVPAKLVADKALDDFAQPDVLLGCDVLLNQADAEELSRVLQILMRSPQQVAYFMDPYTRPHRKLFMQYCESMGLEAKEEEIVTWEPEWDNFLEFDREWVMRLITIRRA
ncbi:unnamed protein product [Effrenium voratum]|nr:unnamed protein product [Effrenium voratum]